MTDEPRVPRVSQERLRKLLSGDLPEEAWTAVDLALDLRDLHAERADLLALLKSLPIGFTDKAPTPGAWSVDYGKLRTWLAERDAAIARLEAYEAPVEGGP